MIRPFGALCVGDAGLSFFQAGILVNRPTKGTIEAEVANAVVRFQREQQGRGPNEVRAHLIGDLLLVRCGGIFTPTEARLAASEEGRRLIKSARQELRSIVRPEIETIIGSIVGGGVLRSYMDVDVEAAEMIEVYVLEMDLEKRLLRQELDRLGTVAPKRDT
jgi:uncharacterized protein YbcI